MSTNNDQSPRAGDGKAVAERDAFEAWITSVATFEDDQGAINLRYLALHKHYVDFDVDRAWQVWQARAALAAAPAAAPATGWTGNADADLALILLDRLDDTGEGNAVRIDQLEGLVRKLAAAQDSQIKALRPLPFSNAEIDRLYANIPPTAQQDARSREAFRRIVRVVEAGHDIRAVAVQAPATVAPAEGGANG